MSGFVIKDGHKSIVIITNCLYLCVMMVKPFTITYDEILRNFPLPAQSLEDAQDSKRGKKRKLCNDFCEKRCSSIDEVAPATNG